ncbi:adult-specific rigid cuticular protein 15.5-like [Uloborus diversus]|uniref:adult-specific rigid cuticular protein 15.5-like n=1 Tax=Uloborus diversus TaxID=327109 RepID=UPI0024094102|nr:adult-specific rigid cuticular protein 15.5-like [Uloborus diversus]
MGEIFKQNLLHVSHQDVEKKPSRNPVHHAPKPYKFGYNIKDKHGDQYREEVGDGASGVKGSYGFTDARGVHRRVDYVADHAGFRAQVKTNEPGTANQDPAAVRMISSAPYAGPEAGLLGAGLVGAPTVLAAPGIVGVNGLGLGYGGLGYNNLGYADLGYGLNNALLGGLGYARYGY